MNSSLCQWLQLCGKELVAGKDGQEILGNSFHKGLKYNKDSGDGVANSQIFTNILGAPSYRASKVVPDWQQPRPLH